MLCIRQEKHLARELDFDVPALRSLAESAASYCQELELHDPAKPNKVRDVLDVRGPLRKAQRRIHDRILLPRLSPSDHSFGCVRGRNIKMNAERHMRSQFAFSCDITNCYPTIHYIRVYDFFTQDQQCSPDVARLLTQLCTHDFHLALGLITSPLLAEQFLKPIDNRIAKMARAAGLVYTRYVDDITLSGQFDLRKSGFPNTVKQILRENGFSTNDKDQFGQIGEPEILITKIRVNRGHLDVSRKYVDDLIRNLRDLRTLGNGGEFTGPYYTSGQMWGRVHFVSWINRNRWRQLRKMFCSVRWKNASLEAKKRRLVVCKKTLRPKVELADRSAPALLDNALVATGCI